LRKDADQLTGERDHARVNGYGRCCRHSCAVDAARNLVATAM
jgi:hypothetical protein